MGFLPDRLIYTPYSFSEGEKHCGIVPVASPSNFSVVFS